MSDMHESTALQRDMDQPLSMSYANLTHKLDELKIARV